MKKVIFSWTLLIACNLMWALQFTCIKLTQDQVGKYFTVWGPMLLSMIFLMPFVIRGFKKRKSFFKDILLFVPLALLGAFPAQVFMTWGTQNSIASNGAIITLSLPIITSLFAFLMLKEKMNKIRWMSFIMAIIGVVLCSAADIKDMNFGSRYVWGNILIFLAIIGSAYYNVGCKKVAERYTAMEMLFYTYFIMVILLTPFVLYYEPGSFSAIPDFSRQTWIGMGLLTLFHNFLSMVLFFTALKTLDAMQVALSNYLITFMALPIAAIWLGERPGEQVIIGGLLIFFSTLIITIIDYRLNNTMTQKPLPNE